MFKQLFSGMFSNTDSLPITDVEQAIKSTNAVLLDVRDVDAFAS
ncbi:rhodanese-like domain-containing protein, partial [Streptococcus suis]